MYSNPRTTSLSIVHAAETADAAEERFFQKLEAEVRLNVVVMLDRDLHAQVGWGYAGQVV